MMFNISLRLFDISISYTARKHTEKMVSELWDNINASLEKQDYGNSILEYEIILYVINMPKGYEHLYTDFKPKYIEHKLLTNKLTGEKYEINKYFNYSIKIEGELYSKFISSVTGDSKRILASEILKSLLYLDALPKKVDDFDKEQFRADMECFLDEEI
ncbi:hypothetical protein LQ567_24290 [Niabella pedocola]|uniref:Uncharacterized protein n=1 Tax=Niabella pedocola TaxID=1752077 RepID=A0ABS8PXW7_9BACT|nr:hypothetical protein [Niabella pedocola]MCD2425925.1 hypothetical protein [Niabella pedocola]